MSTAAAESYVNTGVWTNWSHGRVLGATLTLSQRSGAVLAAFLAIFVSFAGSMFWQILSYAVHQALATKPGGQSDGLHQQRQVILRNSSTAGTALWKITTLAQAWQGHAPRSLLRLAPFIFLAAVNVVVFSLASIFTSAVTTAPGTAVLIRGPSCGRVLELDALGDQAASQAKLAGDTYEAATYARQCYQSESPGPACEAFPRPRLTYAADGNASCPFVSGLCYFSDTAAFSMDTGLLDSHGDLGVNAPPEHRVQFRRVTTCAPLHPGRWTRIENDTRYGGQVLYLEAGPWKPYTNYTFFYPHRARGDNFGYTLQTVFAIAGYQSPKGGWEPDESLNRTDADVVLLMLNQNTVSYLKPSDDPWMPAHQFIPPTNMTEPIWVSDYDATVLGCAEQYQFCNPNNGKCTKLTGHQRVFRDLPLGDEWNEFQQATMNRIIMPAVRMNLENAIAGRGGAALNANELVSLSISQPIPPTQWQTEVSIWFSIGLAKLQSYMVEWATVPKYMALSAGPPTDANKRFALSEPFDTVMCDNQVVHSALAYQNFSVLGLALIVALGGLIILTGLIIERIGGWVVRVSHRSWADLQWKLEDVLQLLRAGYDGSGSKGIWRPELGSVPLTTSKEAKMSPSSEVWGVVLECAEKKDEERGS